MELRVLRYFLAVAREETITAAAEALHVTQPTLSRQLMELEEGLGRKLFHRGSRKISLTEVGLFLRKRAEEILGLAERTEKELRGTNEPGGIAGEVHIGGGESEAMRLVARTAAKLRAAHPKIVCRIHSGNADDIGERLDRGLVDFALFIEPVDLDGREFIRLPRRDAWGLLVRQDHPLAAKDAVAPADLRGLPLICSNQTLVKNELAGWLGPEAGELDVAATYNLLFNASLMVAEGLGCALCLAGIARTGGDTGLAFRPLTPPLRVGVLLAWKKYQVFSRAAAAFLALLQDELGAGGERGERS